MEEVATATVQAELKKAGRPTGSKKKVSSFLKAHKGLVSRTQVLGCPEGRVGCQRQQSIIDLEYGSG